MCIQFQILVGDFMVTPQEFDSSSSDILHKNCVLLNCINMYFYPHKPTTINHSA